MDLSEFGKVKEQNSCARSADWEPNVLELFEKFFVCESAQLCNELMAFT